MHARGGGEAARRAKRGPSVTRAAICLSRFFSRQTTEKSETARSLLLLTLYATVLINIEFLLAVIVIYHSFR